MTTRIKIVIDVYDENADSRHEMGITNKCYEDLMLSGCLPGDVVTIAQIGGDDE